MAATATNEELAWRRWLKLGERVLMLQVGLMLFGLALALGFEANLGLHPWGLFQNALTRFVPLSYGQINILVGAIMIGVSWLARVPPGFGTVCNMVFVGLWLDLFIAVLPTADNPFAGGAVLLIGLFTLAFSSALYIKAGLGAGPRDSFMIAIIRWTGWRVGLARAAMDGSVFVIGAILDPWRIGIGTIVYTFGLPPAMDWTFRLLRVPARGGRREGPTATGGAEGTKEDE
jgi:uncharacterized membrane protein YczE